MKKKKRKNRRLIERDSFYCSVKIPVIEKKIDLHSTMQKIYETTKKERYKEERER